MSATLASLYEGLLCSVLTYFLKAWIFYAVIENGQLLQYGDAYQLNDRTNVKTVDAHTAERCKNGNICTSEWSCNRMECKLLLTATVPRWHAWTAIIGSKVTYSILVLSLSPNSTTASSKALIFDKKMIDVDTNTTLS